jgi:transcriptional regulator with XRE-family HTH domain
MKLGENIKNYRLFRQMTQEELAKKLNRSKSVISHWEKGENNPDLDTCEELCRILSITPNQLFAWKGEMNPDYEKQMQRLMRYQAEIDNLFSQKQEIEKKIHDLEVKKFEEYPPEDFV